MRSLILAAGLGSRLEHKTKHIPKAMVEVNGTPIITHQIRALQFNNINEVGVVLGYKSEILKEYLLGEHPDIKFNFFFNDRYSTSNSSYSFYLASEYVKNQSYIHLNCDILFSSDMLKKLINSPFSNAIAINYKQKLTDNMELVSVSKDKKILKMSNIYFNDAEAKAYGLAKLSSDSNNWIIKKIDNFLANGDFNQNYYGIIREAVNHLDYYVVDSDELLLSEINTLIDYDLVSKVLD
jgi:choline kinase